MKLGVGKEVYFSKWLREHGEGWDRRDIPSILISVIFWQVFYYLEHNFVGILAGILPGILPGLQGDIPDAPGDSLHPIEAVST